MFRLFLFLSFQPVSVHEACFCGRQVLRSRAATAKERSRKNQEFKLRGLRALSFRSQNDNSVKGKLSTCLAVGSSASATSSLAVNGTPKTTKTSTTTTMTTTTKTTAVTTKMAPSQVIVVIDGASTTSASMTTKTTKTTITTMTTAKPLLSFHDSHVYIGLPTPEDTTKGR